MKSEKKDYLKLFFFSIWIEYNEKLSEEELTIIRIKELMESNQFLNDFTYFKMGYEIHKN